MTHPIQRYMEETGTPRTQIATWLGCSEQTVVAYIKKTQTIPRARAVELSARTGGSLTIKELLFPDGVPEGAVLDRDSDAV